ncbi:hypothetical protein SteCoe_17816 [Stentor coeruleus]|uniref:Calcium-dependent protein kinase 1 n=1 Tax=Stentor coeruleus TaxID=5963 RepID=A0A1R2BXX5_9CILI|nr:hypothetical protein SteCoe_17816 [Stentor coeruleus]
MGCCQSSESATEEHQFKEIFKDHASNTFSIISVNADQLGQACKDIQDSAIVLEVGKAQDFVNDNIKDPALQISNKVGGYVRENIQETLDAIKDLKLKQRVKNIIAPIFHKFFIHSLHGIIEDSYSVHEILGQGSFSTVRRAVHSETNLERAVKIVTKNSITDTQKLDISEEIEILKRLDHANIIKIIEVIEDTTKLNIITEYCKGGELFDRIMNCKTFSENAAANYMFQILSGLIHIHENGVVHRDLKPENILFVENNSDYLKIIDFGIAKRLEGDRIALKCKGTAYYIAPEVISGEFNHKCDVWSCGIILYIMLCGHPPFNGRTESEIFAKISRGVFNFSGKEWAGISKSAKNLVQKMLIKDVNKRLSAKEAWEDPWIQSRAKCDLEDTEINTTTMQALANFRTNYKLQQATLSYIACNLTTNSEIEEMKNAFIILDSNGDGHLNEREIRLGYANITLSNSVDINKILCRCDIDLNGMVDYSEFITATIDWGKCLTHEMLENAFKAYDIDRSGTISIDEVREFLGGEYSEMEKEWGKILNDIGKNDDGEIDLQEFKQLMLKIL